MSKRIQASTFQVPCGEYSIWNDLRDRIVTPFQATVYPRIHLFL